MFDTYEQLNAAACKFGDAFYILDSKLFEHNYDAMTSAFRAYYPDTHIAYSYKTNYMPRLCRIIQEKGGYAEVVSEMEWLLALKLGIAPTDIYYNGPYKKREYIEKCMLTGVHINLDAAYEIDIVSEIADRNRDRTFEVGIRCNVDIGQEEPSRFGFDVASGEFDDAMREINKCSNMRVSGLHCHLPFRSLSSFQDRMRFINKLFAEMPDYNWSYISLGGGYMGSISQELSKEFSFQPPSFGEYAAVVAGGIEELYKDKPQKPRLIIEPGSALVANAMKYVTRVADIKYVRDRHIATLSGSIYNINPSTKGIKRPITVYSDGQERFYESVDMAGYTCIESDYLYKGYKGYLAKGDFVVFHNVGSYSLVMKPPFILPDVPCLEMNDGTIMQVKRKQSVESIFEDFA